MKHEKAAHALVLELTNLWVLSCFVETIKLPEQQSQLVWTDTMIENITLSCRTNEAKLLCLKNPQQRKDVQTVAKAEGSEIRTVVPSAPHLIDSGLVFDDIIRSSLVMKTGRHDSSPSSPVFLMSSSSSDIRKRNSNPGCSNESE
eukprot:768353-Hanusia_phi.AAC.2